MDAKQTQHRRAQRDEDSHGPLTTRGATRREFLADSARLGTAGVFGGALSVSGFFREALAQGYAPHFFTSKQWSTLAAALAQLVPAERPGDWSAADAGAGVYIDLLLSSFDDLGQPVDPAIYAGGPFRPQFTNFQALSRVKQIGWGHEIARLRALYRDGLAELDRRTAGPLGLGGSFATVPPLVQESVLVALDVEGSPFFAALYDHTMEGIYSHPAYGGNQGFVGWETLCYQGDVHGVRFPDRMHPPGTISDGAWNQFGGYAPEEMIQPGTCPGQGPVEP